MVKLFAKQQEKVTIQTRKVVDIGKNGPDFITACNGEKDLGRSFETLDIRRVEHAGMEN